MPTENGSPPDKPKSKPNYVCSFGTQFESLKSTFAQQHITLVGDRGMIRKPQQAAANEAGHHYISALHKAEIQTLLKAGKVQMDLFDNDLHETTPEEGCRLRLEVPLHGT